MMVDLYVGAILGLVFVVYSVVVVAVRRAAWQTIDNERNSQSWFFPITLLVWLAVTAIYAISGLIQREPRLMMTVMLPAFVGAATLASTTVGSRLARSTPWFALIGFHAFRLMIELAFHGLYLQGRLPIQVTFHGLNFDILTGITAIALSLWTGISRPPRFVLIAWNTVGLALVAAIVVVASLSMPTPLRQFLNEPSTILMSTFPFIWVPTFLAPIAMAGHVVVYRKLLLECCSPMQPQVEESPGGCDCGPKCLPTIKNDSNLCHTGA